MYDVGFADRKMRWKLFWRGAINKGALKWTYFKFCVSSYYYSAADSPWETRKENFWWQIRETFYYYNMYYIPVLVLLVEEQRVVLYILKFSGTKLDLKSAVLVRRLFKKITFLMKKVNLSCCIRTLENRFHPKEVKNWMMSRRITSSQLVKIHPNSLESVIFHTSCDIKSSISSCVCVPGIDSEL